MSCPAIMELGLWEAAQRRLEVGRKNAKRNRKFEYLMSSRIRCSCGYGAHGRENYVRQRGWTHVYVCNATRNLVDRRWRCDMPQFVTAEVDAAVWQYVEDVLLNPEALAAGVRAMFKQTEDRQRELQSQRDTLHHQRTEIERQLDRLLDLYITGGVEIERYARREAELKQASVSLEQSIAELDARLTGLGPSEDEIEDLKQFATDLRAGFQVLDYDEKRRILELLDVQATMTVEEGQHVLCVVTPLQSSGVPHLVGIDPQPICTSSTPSVPSGRGRAVSGC